MPEQGRHPYLDGPMPALLGHRLPRGDGEYQPSRSWIGGAPTLGDLLWPRRPDTGLPLPFVAQIDLDDVQRHAPEMIAGMMPEEAGSIAIFYSLGIAGEDDWGFRGYDCGAFAILPATGLAPVDPPEDLPFVVNMYGEPSNHLTNPGPITEGRRLFPRLPISFAPNSRTVYPCDGPDHSYWPDRVTEETGFRKLETDKGRLDEPRFLVDANGKRASWPRHLAGRLAREVRHTKYRRDKENFEEYVQLLDNIAKAKSRWSLMSEDELAAFDAAIERMVAMDEGRNLRRVDIWLSTCRGAVVAQAMTESREAWMSLPSSMRDHLDQHLMESYPFTIPMMFGHDTNDQMSGEELLSEGFVLLFRFREMFAVRFPYEDGSYQFWIRPEDLKAKRWERTIFLVEGT